MNAMKVSRLLKITLLLFIIVSTNYFWEEYLGLIGFIMLGLIFLAISFYQLKNLFGLFTTKFTDKSKIINFSIITILLFLIAYKPDGIINFESLEAHNKLVATEEGGGGCNMTLKLKENNKYKLRFVCFSIYKCSGNYKIKNDTIQFNPPIYVNQNVNYEFGIINHELRHKYGSITLYKNKKDSLPYYMLNTYNEFE